MTIKQRSFITYLLLSWVTCGIYPIYFWYKFAEDVNIVCAGDGDETPSYIMAWLLGMVTCGIYTIYWYYKLANRMQNNGPRYGLVISENGTTYLLWSLVGALLCAIGPYIAMYQMIKNLNTLSEAFNRLQMGGGYYGQQYAQQPQYGQQYPQQLPQNSQYPPQQLPPAYPQQDPPPPPPGSPYSGG